MSEDCGRRRRRGKADVGVGPIRSSDGEARKRAFTFPNGAANFRGKGGKKGAAGGEKIELGNGARGEKPELGRGDRRKRADEGCGKVLKGRAGGAVKDVAGGKNSGGRAR